MAFWILHRNFNHGKRFHLGRIPLQGIALLLTEENSHFLALFYLLRFLKALQHIFHWFFMLAFIHGHSTSLHLLKVTLVLHLNNLGDWSDVAQGICLSHNRLCSHLVDNILNELRPLH